MKKLVSSLLLALCVPFAHAGSTDGAMGISPHETYRMVQSQGDQVLFIDVRDPVEVMFIGFTDEVHANIPFMVVDRHAWDEENRRFMMRRNPEFAQQVAAALEARGLPRDATIITMCRSGSERGEPSARFLRENGFAGARFVEGGFQGDVAREGERAGFRLVNGWQNSGLPWQPRMNPEKIHRP